MSQNVTLVFWEVKSDQPLIGEKQEMRQITDTDIANRADHLVDRPYHLGDVTGEEGWDCLSALIAFYRDYFPSEYKGITADNYAEFWKRDEVEARKLFIEFLLSLGENVEVNYLTRGDLVLFRDVRTSPDNLWAGIYLGNSHIWVCIGPEKGCRVINIKNLTLWAKQEIVSIRRILK